MSTGCGRGGCGHGIKGKCRSPCKRFWPLKRLAAPVGAASSDQIRRKPYRWAARWTGPAQGLYAAQADVFHLHEVVHAVDGALAAQAGLLHAAKRRDLV